MSITLYVITKPYPIVEQFEEETTYSDPKSKKRLKFPSISEAESLNLSVIVPAYNEEKRCKLLLCLVGILRTNLASMLYKRGGTLVLSGQCGMVCQNFSKKRSCLCKTVSDGDDDCYELALFVVCINHNENDNIE